MSLADLPAPHRRGVQASLKLMEERLAEVARWLEEGALATTSINRVDDLGEARRREIGTRIEALLARVRTAMTDLGFAPEPMELSRLCLGTLGLTWELAPDLRPSRMTGYGKVPESLAPELQRLADDLEQPLLEMMRLLETKREG